MLLSDEQECTRVIKTLFKEIKWIDSVKYIGVEFIPTPIEDYIDDKTAFDAIIITRSKSGKKGLISIETKYTDILGENSSARNEKKNRIIKKEALFSKGMTARLKSEGYKQIYRNFLLTYTYAKKNGFSNFCNVIISPWEDILSLQEMEELTASLVKHKDCVQKIDLEEFLERGICTGSAKLAGIYQTIKNRYIV